MPARGVGLNYLKFVSCKSKTMSQCPVNVPSDARSRSFGSFNPVILFYSAPPAWAGLRL